MAICGLIVEEAFRSDLSVMRMKCHGCSLCADGALMAACMRRVRISCAMGWLVNARIERRVRMDEIKSPD